MARQNDSQWSGATHDSETRSRPGHVTHHASCQPRPQKSPVHAQIQGIGHVRDIPN